MRAINNQSSQAITILGPSSLRTPHASYPQKVAHAQSELITSMMSRDLGNGVLFYSFDTIS